MKTIKLFLIITSVSLLFSCKPITETVTKYVASPINGATASVSFSVDGVQKTPDYIAGNNASKILGIKSNRATITFRPSNSDVSLSVSGSGVSVTKTAGQVIDINIETETNPGEKTWTFLVDSRDSKGKRSVNEVIAILDTKAPDHSFIQNPSGSLVNGVGVIEDTFPDNAWSDSGSGQNISFNGGKGFRAKWVRSTDTKGWNPTTPGEGEDLALGIVWEEYSGPTSTGIFYRQYTLQDLCGNESQRVFAVNIAAQSFSVSFDSLGGSSVQALTATEGNPVAKPSDPSKPDNFFLGWYTKADGSGSPYDFATPVTSNFSLYAKWIGIESLKVTNVIASADTYIKELTGTAFGATNSGYLQIKNDKSGDTEKNTTRQIYFSFDIPSTIDPVMTQLLLDVEAPSGSARVEIPISVFFTNNASWDEATLKGTDTRPSKEGNSIGSIDVPQAAAGVDINPRVVAIDLGNAFKNKSGLQTLTLTATSVGNTKEMQIFSKDNALTQGTSPSRTPPTLKFYSLP